MPQTKKMNLKYKDDCLKCFVPQNQDEQIPETCTYVLATLRFALPHWTEGKKPTQVQFSPQVAMNYWAWWWCESEPCVIFEKQLDFFFKSRTNLTDDRTQVCPTQLWQQKCCCSLLPFSVKPHPPWASSALERTRHYYRTFIFQNVLNQQSCSNNSSVPMRRQDSFASQHLHKTLLAALHTGERNKNHTNPTCTVLLTFIQFSFWIPKYFIFVSEDIIMDIELVWNRSL